MTLMRIALTILLSMLSALATVQAQDSLDEETIEIRRYTVEMIIFRYAQQVSAGTEKFNFQEQAAPEFDEEQIVIDGELLEEMESVSRIYRDIDFTPLPENQMSMGEIMSRLNRLDAYEPLMHFAWTQATWPDEDTSPIELSKMGRTPPELSGTLRLYLSRFLHLVVDLKLQAPSESSRPDAASEDMLSYGDYRSIDESGSLSEPYDFRSPRAVHYRIDENRIFKSGDLRYFDHPKFGVLAKVMRVEDDAEVPVEPEDSELLGYPAQ